ncbi:hypothetical protein Tco_0522190 [Tanacetum coccineum]
MSTIITSHALKNPNCDVEVSLAVKFDGGGGISGGGGFNGGGLGGGGVVVVVVDGCVKGYLFIWCIYLSYVMFWLYLLYARRVSGSSGYASGGRIGVVVVLIQEMVEVPKDNYKVNRNISCC